MKAQIIKTVYIEAARCITGASNNICFTGNSYRIDLVAESTISATIGWVVDYAELKNLFEPVRQRLDHHCLNDIPGLESDTSPSAIEAWINNELQPWPEWFSGARVYPPSPSAFSTQWLEEEPISCLPERLAFTFSAAQSLPQLPYGHPCRELHGHTYQIEIACIKNTALPRIAEMLFNQLHNRYLNQIQGLEQATAERIAVWVWMQLEKNDSGPIVVVVQETPNNRCYYFGK
jgi:6-pyruvoyltetrahydropterin/6-carboxytetrahydropterin synthase